MKVIYLGATDYQIKWGNNDDPRGILKEGTEYEVADKEVHTWHTKYILAEFPYLRFNSTCFKEDTCQS